MIVEVFVCGPIENNTIVVVCDKTKKALVIDPGFGSHNKIKNFINKNKYSLEKILLTHAHWDHIADVEILKEIFSCPVYVHKLDKDLLENPQRSSSFSMITIPSITPDKLLEDNERIKMGEIEFLTIFTPGHTPGSVCYYIEKEKILFSGDTLFKGAFGRVDFPYSNPQDMVKSLMKLSKLPKDVKVYPGHGSFTTIGKENWIENIEKFI
jgi:glyoxylase-like metal-dependent hydrolase (beta-lactamase superfamily II)